MSGRTNTKRGGKGRRKDKFRRRRGEFRLTKDEAMTAGRDAIAVRKPGLIIPNQTISNLHFWAMQTHSNNGLSYTNIRYIPNQPYDVDPLVGSTAIAGLTEMAAFYSAMRAIKYRYEIDISNNEAFPVTVYVMPSLQAGTDPGSDTVSGLDYPMNPLAKSYVLSAKGGQDRHSFKGTINLADYYTKQVLTDDSYASGIGSALTAPVRIYIVAGACSGSVNFTTAGVTYSTHLYIDTVFYVRKELTT